MDFEWSEEQALLRESVARFLSDRADLESVRRCWGDDTGLGDGVWEGMCELGLPGLLVPEAEGGTGLGSLEMGVVAEELGRVVHPGPLVTSAFVATPLLAEVADEDARWEWLPGLTRGELRATLALEAQVETTGESRLSGELPLLHDAAAAELWLVPVGSGPALDLFAVERDDPGVSRRPLGQVDGSRRLFAATLEDAQARRVASGSQAADALASARDRASVCLTADAVGAAERALQLACAYALEREQFGRPIGSFQSIQHLLVDMLSDLEQVRAATVHALWALDQPDVQERRLATAVARAAANERLPRLGASAIQVFGGIGFTWESDIHLFDKRLCSAASLGELAAVTLERLADAVLGEASKNGGEARGSA